MEIVCPIDAELGTEISALLTPPSPADVDEYLNELIQSSSRQCNGITVKQNGELGKGKTPIFQISHHSFRSVICSLIFRYVRGLGLERRRASSQGPNACGSSAFFQQGLEFLNFCFWVFSVFFFFFCFLFCNWVFLVCSFCFRFIASV